MDLSHARTLLQRINRVFDDLGEGGAAPSALERDLLKEYVRRFYESLSVEEATEQRSGGRAKSPREDTEATSPPRPRDSTRRPLPGRQLRRTSQAQPVATAAEPASRTAAEPAKGLAVAFVPSAPPQAAPVLEVAPRPAPVPAILHVPDSVEADVREIESGTPAVVAPAQTATSAAPSSDAASGSGATVELEPALRELFARERGTDLGDRLGNAPVADLTRAMALNQRLVVQNQLFGKDAAALREALAELNAKSDYPEAQRALARMARRYDWLEDDRRSAARGFVRLVQRRYAAA